MKQMNIILTVLGTVILCVLSYSLISLPFMPPEPSSSLATIPPVPPVTHEDNASLQQLATEGETVLTQSSPDINPPVTDPLQSEGQTDVELLVKDFHSRHKTLPDTTLEYQYDGLRKDLFEICCMVLKGSESRDMLLILLNHPDMQVRINTIEALWDASLAIVSGKGLAALNGLLAQLDAQQTDAVVVASIEALIQATREGTESNAHYVLMKMHALPAVPHLIWVSDNHSSPEMRFMAMLYARTLAPNSNATYDLLQRRLADSNRRVRLLTMRYIVTSWF